MHVYTYNIHIRVHHSTHPNPQLTLAAQNADPLKHRWSTTKAHGGLPRIRITSWTSATCSGQHGD